MHSLLEVEKGWIAVPDQTKFLSQLKRLAWSGLYSEGPFKKDHDSDALKKNQRRLRDYFRKVDHQILRLESAMMDGSFLGLTPASRSRLYSAFESLKFEWKTIAEQAQMASFTRLKKTQSASCPASEEEIVDAIILPWMVAFKEKKEADRFIKFGLHTPTGWQGIIQNRRGIIRIEKQVVADGKKLFLDYFSEMAQFKKRNYGGLNQFLDVWLNSARVSKRVRASYRRLKVQLSSRI